MTIWLENNIQLGSFNYDEIKSDILLKKNSEEFLSFQKESQDSIKCLYVAQREIGTVSYIDPYIDIIGSDDATTCHIVIIVDEANSNVSLCHFDGSDTETGIFDMVKSLKNLREHENSEYSLYIVGGFDDDRGSSQNLTKEIFDCLLNRSEKYNLKLCIVTDLNTINKNGINYPIIYGIGYDIKQKKAFWCNKFLNTGPDMLARRARHFSEGANLQIYDPLSYRITIQPFTYVSSFVRDCLSLPKKSLLQYFSTSPEQEPSNFVDNLLETFKFMLEHQAPLETYFINNKPKIYSKHLDGSWQLIE